MNLSCVLLKLAANICFLIRDCPIFFSFRKTQKGRKQILIFEYGFLIIIHSFINQETYNFILFLGCLLLLFFSSRGTTTIAEEVNTVSLYESFVYYLIVAVSLKSTSVASAIALHLVLNGNENSPAPNHRFV